MKRPVWAFVWHFVCMGRARPGLIGRPPTLSGTPVDGEECRPRDGPLIQGQAAQITAALRGSLAVGTLTWNLFITPALSR